MIFRNLTYRFIGQTVLYSIYLIVTFFFMVNCLTYWLNFSFVTLAYIMTSFVFIGVKKLTTLSFFPRMNEIFSIYFIGQLVYSTILYIVMVSLYYSGNTVPSFLGYFHLIQIPVTLVFILLLTRLKVINKHIENNLKEEKATVQYQRQVASSINMIYASNYDYKIKDRLSTLVTKCRGIGLTTNDNAANVDQDINLAIDVLNEMLQANAPSQDVSNQISKIEGLLSYRRQVNRRY